MIRLFKGVLETIAWLQICLLPTVILGLIGYVVYANNRSTSGLVLSVILSLSGLVAGIYIAEKIRKSVGCSTAIFRVFTSHDVTKWASERDGKNNEAKGGKIG